MLYNKTIYKQQQNPHIKSNKCLLIYNAKDVPTYNKQISSVHQLIN